MSSLWCKSCYEVNIGPGMAWGLKHTDTCNMPIFYMLLPQSNPVVRKGIIFQISACCLFPVSHCLWQRCCPEFASYHVLGFVPPHVQTDKSEIFFNTSPSNVTHSTPQSHIQKKKGFAGRSAQFCGKQFCPPIHYLGL